MSGAEFVPVAIPKSEKCVWWNDEGEDEGIFSTQCGRFFTLNEGNPIDNGMNFCYHCGKPLDYTPPGKET